ncbi:expressed unknown protein [Seminavis robusta]|uniref:Uncharacterized protein n=1 Tax=Seminavis robusta TaxID=568900 RepID=A0A9N8HWE0_9STRA|nr:expressed unknown protein [Seminavis robusta]|eukprot:Sro2154_g316810.1 n/a (129) ;mRNA; f:9139-9601
MATNSNAPLATSTPTKAEDSSESNRPSDKTTCTSPSSKALLRRLAHYVLDKRLEVAQLKKDKLELQSQVMALESRANILVAERDELMGTLLQAEEELKSVLSDDEELKAKLLHRYSYETVVSSSTEES